VQIYHCPATVIEDKKYFASSARIPAIRDSYKISLICEVQFEDAKSKMGQPIINGWA
jgi:hypothetical protein